MDRQWLFDSARDLAQVIFLIAIVSIPVSIFMGHLRVKQQITHNGYQIAQATHEHRQLIEENKKLSIEAAIQGRSDRVVSLAKERFGLEPARHEQILIIPIDDSEPREQDDKAAPRHASLGLSH